MGRFIMINAIRCFFVLVLVLSAGALTLAQVDPTKVLIGTWEGQIEMPKSGDQILIITNQYII